jgi:Anaerobic dehydrogenases, typically selenocysteine-containing
MSRRRFLTGAAALATAPLLAGLWPKAALAQAISEALPQFIVLRQAQKGILTGAHWGAFEAIVQDGKMVGVQPVQDDPYPNELITMAPYQVHAENRIKYPMVRKSWLEGAPAAAPSCAAVTSGCASAGTKRPSWCAMRSLACKKITGRSRSTPVPTAGKASACCTTAARCCSA